LFFKRNGKESFLAPDGLFARRHTHRERVSDGRAKIVMAAKGKVKDMIAILRNDGWTEIKSGGGGHRQFKHPEKRGKVTVDGNPSQAVDMQIWNAMLKQAGLK
jgi:predicted RNA binding protein YcfA (HicA-like mRNA interferase family)